MAEFERYADIKRLNFITGVLTAGLPSGAEVLDVGCGNGVISRRLGELGFRVKGVDVSEKAIEKARSLNKSGQVSFEVKSAEQMVADGQRYHAIICSEVIEHLHQPAEFLNVVNQVLSDNGVLIVTVPNGRGPRELFVTRPFIRLQKKNNWMWRLLLKVKGFFGYKGTTVQSDADDLTHIQFFTKRSLGELAEQTGFRISRLGKTNFIEDVFPFSLLTKRIKSLQKLDCAIAEKLPLGWTGGFVSVWEKKGK
ncbi:MAG: methyltransferase domain-containing protein [Sphingobacteriales bacterium]|nr:methyltransferase domain-containing protein [Sphingobacteriales bacterium]